MNTPIRICKTIFRASLVASATTLAALSLAGPASASPLDTDAGVGSCPGAPPQPCGNPLHLPFTTTQDSVQVTFTKNPNPCSNYTVQGDIDGATPLTLGTQMPLAPGNHTLNLDASCPGGQLSSWGGHVTVVEFKHTGQPKPAQGAPAQGPTVSAQPGLAGVTFHVTDRSGVASQCTYSSEGFTSDSFALPANGSFDLFVPAIREFRNRTGTVTCDNGTSAGTSVQY
jgi:hypothetical protein